MQKAFGEISVFVLLGVVSATCCLANEVNEPGAESRPVKAAVIPCKDMIDEGLYKSIRRRTAEALDAGAEYLIYEIGTYGGLLKSADDISKYFILDVGKKAHTVAYITTEAISAGAMISVSCQDIIMRENTTIGDCAPIQLGGKLEGIEREKMESFTRAAFRRAAKANNYPEALLKAMVTQQIDVYRLKNLETGEYEFFEGNRLPRDPNVYSLADKELVDPNDEILTLTASDALKYGVARALVNDLDGALDFLAKRDGVRFTKTIRLETIWSEEMVRWVNSPAVMSILVMVALLGVYIELNTPGIGLPGLVAVSCFVIIIGSKYLTGLANWVEVALFVLGVLLLAIEVFVLPGFGIAGFLGISCILAGLFGMLVKNPPDKLPWPQSQVDWDIFANGAIGLLFGFTGFVVFAWLAAKWMPRLQFLSGLLLVPTAAKQGSEVELSMTVPPHAATTAVKTGDVGEVLSKLRPAGKARFGEAIIDVVAEAEFLDKRTKVEIISVHGNRVVVRAYVVEE